MKINDIIFKIKKHAPEELMIIGIAGFVGTVVLACKASFKAEEVVVSVSWLFLKYIFQFFATGNCGGYKKPSPKTASINVSGSNSSLLANISSTLLKYFKFFSKNLLY